MLWLTRKSPLQHICYTRTSPNVRLSQLAHRCRTTTSTPTSPFVASCISMTDNHQACSSAVVKGDTYTDKVVGSFLAALCADALGAAVEGWTAYRIHQTFPDGLSTFENCRMGRGRYTGGALHVSPSWPRPESQMCACLNAHVDSCWVAAACMVALFYCHGLLE